jgi:purine-binding chemotaxis protein CheW
MKPKKPRVKVTDWKAARQRLDKAIAATEGATRLSPAKARAVMDERALALARVPQQEAAGGLLELVVFALGSERYAIETRHVREVVRFTDFTPLPGAPDFLVGITNLRGHILAVVDLRKFFGVAVRGLTDLSRVIVLGEERSEFGVLADSASEVVTLRLEDVSVSPDSVAGVAREYLRGVTSDLMVLDGTVLLQDSRLFIDQGEETAPGG